MVTFAVYAFFAVIIALGFYLSWRAEQQLTEAWRDLSTRWGFQFTEEDDAFPTLFGDFKLFQQGSQRTARNILQGKEGRTDVWIADYRYTTGGGRHSTTHQQTICVLVHPDLSAPHSFLRPQNFLDTIGRVLGGQDIDFGEDPEFSRAYVLQGEDESAVRTFFKPGIRRYFAERKDRTLVFEARGTALLLHPGKQIPPEQAAALRTEGLALLGLMA